MTATLITGADGHLGQAAARSLLKHGDQQLLLYVRARDEVERAAKLVKLGDLARERRCRVVYGELASASPFTEVDADSVTGIVHAAAATSFAIDKDTARNVNVDGTAKVIEFADRCRSLRRFGFVSTLYAAGLRDGDIDEQPLDGTAPFANHYERSKWRAERLLYGRPDIPWQIYRVGTILGEDESGVVVQQNAVHNTLRLLYYGLLSVVPGDPQARVYFATSAFAADAIAKLFSADETRAIYHVADSGDDAMTLEALADTVYRTFLEDPAFARGRILKPLYCDRAAFDTLVGGAKRFGSAMSQALDSVAPFAPQLYHDKNFTTGRLSSALDGSRSPDPTRLLTAVARHLVATRWGLGRSGGGERR